MNASTWTIRNGKLALLSSSGQVTWPSATEIFDVAFHGASKIAGLSVVSPFDGLPELSFSRFAAPVAVRISGSLPELSAELGVLTDAGFVSVDAGSDSILSGQRWYPVVTDDLLITNQWLSERSIRLGTETTIGDIIVLRQAGDRPFQLIDEALSSPNDIHQITARSAWTPSGLTCELYDYQRDGVAFLRMIADQGIGCVLADEMGLGKTLQVIALLLSEKMQGADAEERRGSHGTCCHDRD